MKVSGFKAMYYGGSVMEKQNNEGVGTGEFDSYLSFVQVNEEKNKMEQVLVTYKGDIRSLSKDGTIHGAGLVAGQIYSLDLDLNVANEKDKNGNAKASRHILLSFAPVKKD